MPTQSRLARGSRHILHKVLGSRLKNTKPGIPAAIERYFSKQDYDSAKIPPCRLAAPTLPEIFADEKLVSTYRFYERNLPETSLLKELSAEKSALSLVYCARFDFLGHLYGPNPQLFADDLKRFDRFIADVFSQFKGDKDTHIVLTSDHGMAPFRGTVNPWSMLPSNVALGKDFLAYFDDTMGRFWFFNEASKVALCTALSSQTVGRLISEKELAHYGINFPDNRYFERLYVLNEGYSFLPSYMTYGLGINHGKGFHGYEPVGEHTSGVFFHSDSSIMTRKSVSMVDVVPSLLTLAGLVVPSSVDGVSFLTAQ